MIAELGLHLRADALLVPVARQQVSALLASAGVVQDDIARAEIVVTEACSNVVKHAYRGQPGWLSVHVQYHAGRLVVAVCDTGVGFDVDSVAAPEVGQVGGYGIHFIRRIADAVAISSSPRGTAVVAELNLQYRDATYLQVARSLDAPSL